MTVKKMLIGSLALLVIALMTVPSLMAQSLVSGDLTGTVTDPSGAVVSGATVTLKSDTTGATRTTTTNASGAYRFSLLQPGSYTVSANASGFSKSQSTTTIAAGQATIADVKMSVGSSSQTVEVTTAAPLVQADNADLSTNFNQTQIANQPNGGNDLTYIAQTTPGVTMNTGMGFGNFQTSGLPATSNLFTVNGENDMDPYLNLNNSGATNLTLGKNDVQEATVVTNAYSGQYGQQAGAQVSYVTKSGTNQFHGNAEYWWTGRAMDANDYFNNLNGTSRPFANNNEWAASLGGRRYPLHRSFVDHRVFSDHGIRQRYAGKPGDEQSGLRAAVYQDVQPVRISTGIRQWSRCTGQLSGLGFRRKLLPVLRSNACSAGNGVHHQRPR
jgi:hypothetical protein